MKRKLFAILSLLALTTAVGCSSKEPETVISSSTTDSSEQVISQDTHDIPADTYDTAKNVKGFDKQRMSENIDVFSTYMFYKTFKNADKENVLLSPFSVYTSLSMLENGANGDTFTELNQALNGYFNLDEALMEFMRISPLPKEQLNNFAKSYNDNSDNKVFSMANAFWVSDDDSLVPNSDFLSISHDYYDSEFFRLHIDSSALKTINDWVSAKTNEKITDFLDEKSGVNPDAAAIILNAVSFEGEWLAEYDAEEMYTDVFHNADETDNIISYLVAEESVLVDDEFAKGFVKEYKDGNFSFAVLMPNENVDYNEYSYRLHSNDVFKNCIKNCDGKTALTYLPKFSFDYDCSLVEVLQSMGIQRAFDEQSADFSNMFEGGSVHVKDVLHKTHIDVNEKGTQAQAATAVIMEKDAMAVVEQEMEKIMINRPFFFCIYDNSIDAPVFIGAVQVL